MGWVDGLTAGAIHPFLHPRQVSVGIVFANKYVFHHFHYDFATLMTALHFFGALGRYGTAVITCGRFRDQVLSASVEQSGTHRPIHAHGYHHHYRPIN